MKNSKKSLAPRTLIVFLLILGGILPGFSQEGLSVRESTVVDSLVNSYMSKNAIPGASIAIIKNNKIVAEKGYGMADLENYSPATPSTIYRLASVSKPITAVAVMQLLEKGLIDLDSPVQRYVSDFPEKKYPITIRQLMAHMSGIRHYEGEEFSSNIDYESLNHGLEIFKNDSLLHEPGIQQTYSTYGYTLLGVVIESVSGMPYMQYLKENIFQPAGMKRTFEDDPIEIIPLRSESYDTLYGGKVVNSVPVNTSYKIPGGGIVSNVGDMAKFLIELQKGKLISKNSWEQMTQEVLTNQGEQTHYGLGWILGIPPFPGAPHIPSAVWHGGVQQGSTTAVMSLPEEGIGVVLLSNSGGFGNEITITTALIADSLRKK